MDAHQQNWNQTVAQGIIAWLEKRRMAGSYAPDAAQAKERVLDLIPAGSTVFRCGSCSTVEMGLWEKIEALEGVKVINPYLPTLSPEEGLEMRRQGLLADVMIASSNAITLDGRLVNLDGMGQPGGGHGLWPGQGDLVGGHEQGGSGPGERQGQGQTLRRAD